MIPNTFSSTGPNARLWVRLKAIEHALSRTLDSSKSGSLSELDKEKLQDLASVLGEAILTIDDEHYVPGSSTTSASSFRFTIDFRRAIEANESFRQWQEKAKKPTKDDIERLRKSVSRFVSNSTGALFQDAPKEEFKTLHAIVRTMLADAEVALQA